MTIAVVTTVTRNYLALARVMMRSVERQHPDALRFILLLDPSPETPVEVPGVQILTPADLIPDRREREILQAIYQPIEYATALKPQALRHLIALADHAYFLDPDTRLFQPMAGAEHALNNGASALLTPHRISPPQPEDVKYLEDVSRYFGMYNTAFVGVTRQAAPLLDWWAEHLRRNCLADIGRMEWTDQRVMDLAPSYFPTTVLRDPGYNVAWWNLDERPLGWEDGTLLAAGAPLVLMHYTNVHVTPGKGIALEGELPQLVHSTQNPVARRPDQLAVLRKLETEYLEDLRAEEYERYAGLPYLFETSPAGRLLAPGERRLYREQVLSAERSGRQAPLVDEISLSLPRRFAFTVSRERPAIRVAARELRTELRDARRGLAKKRRARRAGARTGDIPT